MVSNTIIYLKVFGLLFVLLAIMIGGIFLLKKVSPKSFRGFNQEKLKVLATLNLGPKRSLLVVQFLNTILLIGTTESNICLLKEVSLDDGQNFEDVFQNKLSSNNHSSNS